MNQPKIPDYEHKNKVFQEIIREETVDNLFVLLIKFHNHGITCKGSEKLTVPYKRGDDNRKGELRIQTEESTKNREMKLQKLKLNRSKYNQIQVMEMLKDINRQIGVNPGNEIAALMDKDEVAQGYLLKLKKLQFYQNMKLIQNLKAISGVFMLKLILIKI